MSKSQTAEAMAIAAGLGLCALTPTALADVFHVYSGESIQQAISDAAQFGDEIIVHPGTYEEAIDFIGKDIYLHSSDGLGATIIDATGLNTSVVTCISGEGAGAFLEGFTVRGGVGTHVGNSLVGGGMYIHASNPKVSDCTFTENTADHGAGMHCNLNSSPRLMNCTFLDNEASSNGGGMYLANSCDPHIINCAFIGNSAGVSSGGVHNYSSSSPIVINSIFIQNTAQLGGGMTNTNSADATVVNCTFSLNTAGQGGAMRNYLSTPIVTNCVLWRDNGGEIHSQSCTPIVTYCVVEDGHPGQGNTALDPLLVDPENGDFRLGPGSSGIDAGNSPAVPPGTVTDLDGNPRFVDDPDTPDTGVGFPCVDMGAYEFQATSPCPADINGDGVVDVQDLLAVLAAWGNAGGPEDINGDGIVDVQDLLELLAAWGPC